MAEWEYCSAEREAWVKRQGKPLGGLKDAWAGERRCHILAPGPSLGQMPRSVLTMAPTIGINRCRVPPDLLLVDNEEGWPYPNDRHAPIQVCHDPGTPGVEDISQASHIYLRSTVWGEDGIRLYHEPPGAASSLTAAINLAYYMGIRRIVLFGADFGAPKGSKSYWYGEGATTWKWDSRYYRIRNRREAFADFVRRTCPPDLKIVHTSKHFERHTPGLLELITPRGAGRWR